MRRLALLWGFAVLPGVALAGEVSVVREVVIPQVGEALEVEDVTLASNLSRFNGGAFAQLATGRDGGRRTLLRFHLGPLRGKIGKLREATLRLTPFPRSTLEKVEVAVYEVAAANGGWQEGKGVFTEEAQAGESTWRHLAAPDKVWAGERALGRAGVDYAAEPVAQFAHDDGPVAIPLPTELVEKWIARPEENHGLLLLALDSEGAPERTLLVHSSEAELVSERPALELRFE